tara:strand:+ start:55 stop:663 length:609 start_codon:yes stop_codon:yes gene_type:complete
MNDNFKHKGKSMDKSFIEEQLDLLDARVSKIDHKLENISNNLKVLHDTLLQKSSNIVNINKNLSHKNEPTQNFKEQVEALRKQLNEAIQHNIKNGLPSNCGAVPSLKHRVLKLENPNYKPRTKRLRTDVQYYTPKQKEALGYYNQVQILNINESFSFPAPRGKAERIRRAVRKFNEIYGTNYQIKIIQDWDNLNSVHVFRIQ